MPDSPARHGIRPRRLLYLGLVVVLVLVASNAFLALSLHGLPWETFRTTPVYDPPVLAGQEVYGGCAGGFYARRGQDVILTISAHCASEGQVLTGPDGSVIGVYGAPAWEATCRYPDHTCSPSDLIPLVLAPGVIPWGHLDQVDMGAGGYRTIAPGTAPLACADIRAGDRVEINGRGRHREGKVLASEEYLFPVEQDGTYFPCLVLADVRVGTGDSGGAVLVNGLPAGVTTREVGGYLGFTPLAEGLELLGLTLCTGPDCGLARPAAAP
jgi:hypothetical protein